MNILGLGEDEFRKLALDLLPLVRFHLKPEVPTALRNTFPELDGSKLTDLEMSALAGLLSNGMDIG